MKKLQKIDPVFENISPEDLEKELPEPWWRKPFYVIVGIVILLLVLSFSFSDAIMGIVQSQKTHYGELIFRNTKIIFENNTLQQLQTEFISNEHREIKACLFGRQEESTYIISRVEFPEVIRANVIHIVSVPCPPNTLIDLHSHPINQCLASRQDIAVYENNRKSNPNLRMMIMCSSTRFALV
ncbi:MAG: hypothetical protein QW165_05455 [Candidatus Woesearchaeota archaeon]